MIPKVIYIKNSYELIKSLKISLNNVIISNESDVNRSSLVNYILNNAKDSYTDYGNLQINTSSEEDLNITDYQFILKKNIFDQKMVKIQVINFIIWISKFQFF